MKHLLFILLSYPAMLFAQNSTLTAPEQLISGTFYYTSIYYGGVAVSEEGISPAPMAYAMFYLVRYKGPGHTPEPLQSFTTNDKGEFNLYVSPGEYGFISAKELDSLKAGQYLPASTQAGGLDLITYSTWETDISFPIKIDQKPVQHISVVNHVRTYCYICP